MAITRPTAALKNKVNLNASLNRVNEATAEDFIELARILNDIIDVVDNVTGAAAPNKNYGIYSTLTLLEATYPAAELNAYAIIDAGVGFLPKIALWDNVNNVWVIQETTTTVVSQQINVGSIVTNKEVTDINNNPFLIVSGTYEGPDVDKKESYSKNSISRAL